MNKFLMQLTAICAILLTESIIKPSSADPLKEILSFINEKSGQTSPAFDLTAKPRFENVNASLEQIIQKISREKTFENAPGKDNTTEQTAYQHLETLKDLYNKNTGLFLSDADLLAPNPSNDMPVATTAEIAANDYDYLGSSSSDSTSSSSSDYSSTADEFSWSNQSSYPSSDDNYSDPNNGYYLDDFADDFVQI